MSRSLERLERLRGRLRRHAEAEHKRAQEALEKTRTALDHTGSPAPGTLTPGRLLHAHDAQVELLWRQEKDQRRIQATTHGELLRENSEHKKVEKILDSRRQEAKTQAARRETQAQDAWLRHRLHQNKVK